MSLDAIVFDGPETVSDRAAESRSSVAKDSDRPTVSERLALLVFSASTESVIAAIVSERLVVNFASSEIRLDRDTVSDGLAANVEDEATVLDGPETVSERLG